MKILDDNRLFPADGQARSIAARLYETVRDLPILSPHGHTDPSWFALNQPFPDPAKLLIQPDHYIFRMLYSQGVSLESLGIPQVDGKEKRRPARGLAHLRQALLPLPRNTDAALARLHLRKAVRPHQSA